MGRCSSLLAALITLRCVAVGSSRCGQVGGVTQEKEPSVHLVVQGGEEGSYVPGRTYTLSLEREGGFNGFLLETRAEDVLR